MSEYLRAAREQLRSAVTNIDARLAELQVEQVELQDHRSQLLLLIDGEAAGTSRLLVAPSEVRHAVAAPTPAARPASSPASTEAPTGNVDAATRVERFMATLDRPLRYPELVKASKLTLATGRARRSAGTSAGSGKPADDEAHGVDAVTSVPAPAGMSGSLSDGIHPPAFGRPPVSISVPSTSAKSLAKLSDHHPLDTDAIEDEDEDVDDPDEADAIDAAQAELDAEPAIRTRPGPKPKYKPGHRQLPVTGETAAPSPSWWLRPDADFAAEAERMRLDPKQKKVPGENNIICMNAAF